MSKPVDNSVPNTGGWGDDDQWDDFEDTTPTPPPAPIVSKMKLGGVKRTEPEEDFWTKMGASHMTSGIKEKTPPPPVPAGLFGGGNTGGDEWGGDWDDNTLGLGGHKETQGLTK